VHGPSRKDPAKLAARTLDNVTVIAPAAGLSEADLVARPWLDLRLDAAHVWGCSGTLVGAAERYADPVARPVAPLYDLLAAR
jgi:hypothetical protein